MEDLPSPADSPVGTPEPAAGHDPQDPLNPDIEQEHNEDPPVGDPYQDPELAEDKEELSDDDDDESILSEIDEAQFEDFDPNAIAIEDRPVLVDESNVGLIGKHKRKRVDDADGTKKRKEGRREKSKKSRKTADDDFIGGEVMDGKRSRKSGEGSEKKEKTRAIKRYDEEDENLTPEERRKRALDRAMDEALKNPNRSRKKMAGIDLEAQNDELIERMRAKMTEAAAKDTELRASGHPAMEKLKLLPEVVALINRNNLREQLVDPDTNLLEAVRFFLEPLNDGSLPAYNIQRELFNALAKLPIHKDALVASGIGKVVLFYTKSNKTEMGIRRQAEKLLGDWTRPILHRSDDYRKREFEQKVYDPTSQLSQRSQDRSSDARAVAIRQARDLKLAPPTNQNRARVEGGLSSYSIAPRAMVVPTGAASQRVGASGAEAFRKMKAKYMKAGSARP